MSATIELRAFMDIAGIFRERNWGCPFELDIEGQLTGIELLNLLDIPPEKVEVVFVNGKAFSPEMALISGGDRVALLSQGAPGPYRVLLGFRKMD